jgi:hypothetical protein
MLHVLRSIVEAAPGGGKLVDAKAKPWHDGGVGMSVGEDAV